MSAKTYLLKSIGKWIAKEPMHYSNKFSGQAARIARKTKYAKNPEGPFIAGLIMPKKIKGAYEKGVRHIDERAGELIADPRKEKHNFIQKMFLTKEKVPHPTKKGVFLEHKTSSLSAPIGKASAIATPILGSMYVMDKLDQMRKAKQSNQVSENNFEKQSSSKEGHMNDDKVSVPRVELEKTAAALRKVKEIKEKSDSLEKKASLRERAEKVAFSMVEMGTIPPFKSYDSFQEKVASLMEENLDVVEKALQFNTQKLTSLGELSNKVVGKNALEEFVLEE